MSEPVNPSLVTEQSAQGLRAFEADPSEETFAAMCLAFEKARAVTKEVDTRSLRRRLLATGLAHGLDDRKCRTIIGRQVEGTGWFVYATDPFTVSGLSPLPDADTEATTAPDPRDQGKVDEEESTLSSSASDAAALVLIALGLTTGVMALLLGLLPLSTYEIGDSFGEDSVSCGSAWAPNDDDLTSTGRAACAEGGLNTNRSLSFALLAATVVLVASALVSAARPGGPST